VPASAEKSWSSWSGAVHCRPRALLTPTSEAEVAAAVRAAARDGATVRVAGTGHSFVPLCATDGVLLSLDGLRGVVAIDAARGEALVWGGTPIHELGVPLRAGGVAMETMGDIDRQTIAGAISTGTHGSGPTLGSISTQVVGLRLVTADGAIVECGADREPGLLRIARVALGALGVITQVRLRVLPAYRLHERTWTAPFEQCMAGLDALVAAHRHFEFFWRPPTDACDMKALNATDAAPDPLADRPGERIDHSDRVLPSERLVKFNETEFAIPAERGPDCVREIRALMRSRYPDVVWPVEYRTLAADDIPLSPASGRATVTISVHEAAERPYAAFFADAEAIFRNHRGRPHWGKIHTHDHAALRALYPAWDDFQATRRQLDPKGRFTNAHLATILG